MFNKIIITEHLPTDQMEGSKADIEDSLATKAQDVKINKP